MSEEVTDVILSKGMTLENLIEAYKKVHGFMASHLYEAVEVLKEIKRTCDVRIISFTGNIVATGVRGIISQLLGERLFNVVVTTCGTVDHDIARSFGGKYLKGSFEADDHELHKRGLHRLGNVFIPIDSYGPLIEKKVHEILEEIATKHGRNKVWGVRELLGEIGARIPDPHSILRAASINGIPIYVPGFLDGAFGTALLTYSRSGRLTIDVFKDELELAEVAFRAKNMGALIIGGGISKHHTLWWAQIHGGLDYAVYITTAIEWDGSLSGARPREAITWDKIKENARHVVVYGDATVILPIIAYAALYM